MRMKIQQANLKRIRKDNAVVRTLVPRQMCDSLPSLLIADFDARFACETTEADELGAGAACRACEE